MAERQKIKVVCSGKDVATDSNFNIVKIGEYTPTETGFIAALKDGIFDKYRRESPDFECLYFREYDRYISENKEFTVCVFACREIPYSEDQEETLIAGKATFSRIL